MRFASSDMHTSLSNLIAPIFDHCVEIAQAVLPQHCLLCSAEATTQPLCAGCRAQLPQLTAQRCPQCATPTAQGDLCGRCLNDAPAFTSVSAAWVYAWPLTPLIQQFKYAGNLALTRLLAEAIRDAVRTPVDLVIPMPLAPARLRTRGFNQALELARHVCRTTQTPLAATACRRVLDSAPQAMLPWRQRAKNIRGAFVCDANLAGLRVAVVDDVITTGATLNELARTLRRAGATEVHGWMAARTLKQD
jgi:ComF family protein